jgi:hypothetical protein
MAGLSGRGEQANKKKTRCRDCTSLTLFLSLFARPFLFFFVLL